MTNMNEMNVMTKYLGEVEGMDTGEFYRLDMKQLSPKNRAEFYYWKLFNASMNNYEFSNDEIQQLESGVLPGHMSVDLNNYE